MMDTNPDSPTGHPLYARVQAQMQAEDWAGALASLRMLRVSFPYDPDLERLQRQIEERQAQAVATAAAAVEGEGQRRRRWGVRLLAALLGLLLVGSLLVVAGLAYNQFVGQPTPAASDPAAVAQAQQAMRLALMAGDCRQAEQAYQELLRLAPADGALEMELERCYQQLALDALYAQGVAALEVGDWEAASVAFESLAQQSPDYRDLAAQMNYLAHQQQIETWWTEAQAACQAQAWETCVARLQAIQQTSLHFRRTEVQDLLYQAAMQAGREQLARSAEGGPPLDRAIAYFDLALQQKPASWEARLEQEMAVGYARGWRLFEQQKWAAAAAQWAVLYAIRPDYIGGQLAHWLYLALLRQGEALVAQGKLADALAVFRAAAQIEGVDTAQAQTAAAQLEAVLTPRPTPSETPPPTPVATATPSATPRPAARPTPAPTATPTPLPYRFFSYGATLTSDVVCDSLTVQGWVRDEIGPVPGVEVTIWTDSWQGPMVITDTDGYYYYYLDNHPKFGTWYIKLSLGGEQISDVVTFSTRPDCESNLVYISWEARY